MMKPDSTSRRSCLLPSEAAARLGTTVKALRVYEREGLVRPERTFGGWRCYGPEHLERVQQVLALKELGLPLKRVREFLIRPGAGVATTLALQEEALLREQGAIERRLYLVRAARAKLTTGEALTIDEVTGLACSARRALAPTADEIEARLMELVDLTGTKRAAEELAGAIQTCLPEASCYLDIERTLFDLLFKAGRAASTHPPESDVGRNIAAQWLDLTAAFLNPRRSIADHLEGFDQGLYDLIDAILADPSLAPALGFLRGAVRQALVDPSQREGGTT